MRYSGNISLWRLIIWEDGGKGVKKIVDFPFTTYTLTASYLITSIIEISIASKKNTVFYSPGLFCRYFLPSF